MGMFVKVCGITRPQDADLAVELGASAIGFIFWPRSPRYIPPRDARAIAVRQPDRAARVGVFVDEPVEAVARTMDVAGLDAAQLHGDESVDYCHRLLGLVDQRGSRKWLIKAVSLGNDLATELAALDPEVTVLVDAHDPVRRGGTGRTVNWQHARRLAAERRTILSGGLNAANVGAAIAAVEPYGVDVSSGVEVTPGVKDPAKLRTFFEAINV
jgi:phosphoribosylanthranilate isomerase